MFCLLAYLPNLSLSIVFLQEVKLAVEDCDLNTMTERSAILCSCFVILESTIVTLSKCEVGQGNFYQ